MGVNYNPKIVTDGLVLALDSANKKSLKPENQLQYSEQFDISPWTIYNTNSCTITPNATSGPFGGSAYSVVGSTSTALFYQTLTTGAVGTGKKIASVYAKAYTSSQFTLNPYYVGDTEVNVTFTLSGDGSTNSPSTSIIENVGNGWYKCSAILPARVNSGTSLPWRIWPEARGTYTTKGCYFWGAQLRDSTSGYEYVKTESTQENNDSEFINLVDSSLTGIVSGYPQNMSGSLEFDGTNDYITLDGSTFDFSTGQTINLVLKKGTGAHSARRNPYNQAYGGYGTITSETDGDFSYYHGTNGGNGTPYDGFRTVTPISENELVMLTLTRDVNNVAWYINGELDATEATAYPNTVSTTNTIFIGDGYAGPPFLGEINYVGLYDRGLSAAEVKQNFNALRGRYVI